MKIKRLKILSSFRSLPANYEIVFNGSSNESSAVSPICFVGLNGSGKSNVLELITEIFYFLENFEKPHRESEKNFKTKFGFEIEYELPRLYVMGARFPWNELNKALENTKVNPIIKISKELGEFPRVSVLTNKETLNLEASNFDIIQTVLPARIVAYSSGMNELLSNSFIKMDFKYFEDLKLINRSDSLDMNRMFYLSYDSNKFIAISNFIFDSEDYDMTNFIKGQKATDFGGIDLSNLKRELSIENIRSFAINFKLRKNSHEKDYLPPELNIALDNLKKCATFINESSRKTKKENFLELELVFWVNKSTKAAFRQYFKTAYDLFRAFYFFQLLNTELISQETRKSIMASKTGAFENLSDELPKHESSNLIFRISNITFYKKNQSILEYRKLSDGEHQMIQVFGSLLLMDTTGSLFLFDEPDTHFNPDWRSKFVTIANNSIDKEREQEVILTTHSPYIVSDCKKENVYIFHKNYNGEVVKPTSPEINTFGTSTSILSEIVFGKEDTISELSKRKIEKIRNMPLNSLENIQKAKEASRVLGESVEKVILFKDLISKERELKNDSNL